MSLHRTRDAIVPAVAALALMYLFAELSHGLSFWFTFIPAMALSYVCYMRTSYRRMPDPRRVLPLYLFGIGWQFLHFSEEFATHFYVRWPVEVFHAAPVGVTEFVVLNMISYAAFIAGGLAIWYRFQPLMLIVWFFAIMGMTANGIGHVIYPFVAGTVYFPGLFTALPYLVLGPMLIVRLARPGPSLQAPMANGFPKDNDGLLVGAEAAS